LNVFIDTSALVKLYHVESGSQVLANFLRSGTAELTIFVSDIARVELHSAFMKKVRMKEMELERANEALSLCDRDIRRFYIVELRERVKELAVELLHSEATEVGLRALDAIQLASARVADKILSIDRFITSDKNLLQVAGQFIETFNPETDSH
jgi:predicted nucleic acid-binding protein